MTVVVASSPTEVTFTVPLLAVTGKVSYDRGRQRDCCHQAHGDTSRTAVGREALLVDGLLEALRGEQGWGEGGSPRLAATHEAPRGMSHHPVASGAVCLSRRGDCPRRSLLRLLTSPTVA